MAAGVLTSFSEQWKKSVDRVIVYLCVHVWNKMIACRKRRVDWMNLWIKLMNVMKMHSISYVLGTCWQGLNVNGLILWYWFVWNHALFYSLGYFCDRILSALCLHKSHTCHLHFKSEGNPLMPLRRFLKFFLYTRVSLTDERGNSDRSCVRLLKTVDPSPAALKRAER